MNLKSKKHLLLRNPLDTLQLNHVHQSGTLQEFWRWEFSDILSNATRGIFTEFIVAKALDCDLSISTIRDEWDAHDLTTAEGLRIEVKSSAYLQSGEQEKLSTIHFSIRNAQPWNSEFQKRSSTPLRSADIYVFCLLKHKDKATVDPLNLNQWEFYILSTQEINKVFGLQKSISLSTLQQHASTVSFDDIKTTITSLQHQ